MNIVLRSLGLAFLALFAATAQAAPFELSATKLGGGGVVNVADYRGQVVVVNIFASWCPPCRMEIPDFKAAYEARKDRGFVILGMGVDDPVDIQNLANRLGIDYPIGVLTQDQSNQLIRVLPTTVLLGTDGEIVDVHEGAMSQEELLAKVDPLLPPPAPEGVEGAPENPAAPAPAANPTAAPAAPAGVM